MSINNNFLIASLLLSVFFFNSCEKDKEPSNEEPSNYFSYDGENYVLNQGFIEEFGENEDGSYDFDIVLVSPTIQYIPSDAELSGIGDIVYLDLNTSSANGLVSGSYNFSSERGEFTFVDGGIVIKGDVSTEEAEIEAEIVGGKINVLVVDDITTLDFDLTTRTNKNVKGRFQGTLTPFEF